MRLLYYVPVIHQEADLGSIGQALAGGTALRIGEERWSTHQRALEGFWESIQSFLLALDARCVKVYQDGLTSDGEVGRRIVEEAAQRGSSNYLLLWRLLQKGAELRKAEDPQLLLQERAALISSMRGSHLGVYPSQRDRLTTARDRFIATSIGSTLKDGELGVLFMGAYHQVKSYLPKDVCVTDIKDEQRIVEYFRELLSGQDTDRLVELAHYLALPVVLAG